MLVSRIQCYKDSKGRILSSGMIFANHLDHLESKIDIVLKEEPIGQTEFVAPPKATPKELLENYIQRHVLLISSECGFEIQR